MFGRHERIFQDIASILGAILQTAAVAAICGGTLAFIITYEVHTWLKDAFAEHREALTAVSLCLCDFWTSVEIVPEISGPDGFGAVPAAILVQTAALCRTWLTIYQIPMGS